MLLNPYLVQVESIPGTRIVQDRLLLGFIGVRVPYGDPRRCWTIQSFLLPSPRMTIRGLRAKLQDQKGFVTFCNQRDLEVLLGLDTPGEMCHWLGRKYAEPGDKDWVGFYASEEDLLDDLHERELLIRCEYPIIPSGTSITRLVHIEDKVDVEETYTLLWDVDRTYGTSPDPRFETLTERWARAERIKATWELI